MRIGPKRGTAPATVLFGAAHRSFRAPIQFFALAIAPDSRSDQVAGFAREGLTAVMLSSRSGAAFSPAASRTG